MDKLQLEGERKLFRQVRKGTGMPEYKDLRINTETQPAEEENAEETSEVK